MAFATVPSSTGPLAPLAELAISAPEAAPAGESVSVAVTIRVRATGPRMITTPATCALLVLSGERVVARRESSPGSAPIPLMLRAGAVAPAQAVPSTVRLSAVDAGAPLPPGRYALVAVLGYRTDSLNTGTDDGFAPPSIAREFVLVSEPVPLEIR
jgi:hypothetical protein